MRGVISAALLSLVCAVFAFATVVHVPGDQATIQAGINATSTGDTVLVADGDYSGTGNANLDFGGRAIVVMSENGPAYTTIICSSSGRGVYFHSGETSASVFKGFRIITGNTTYGGGINITSSSPTIEGCIIANNNASQGGGIYMSNASPTIVRCTIADNSASSGGAIYLVNSSPVITTSIVASNSASG